MKIICPHCWHDISEHQEYDGCTYEYDPAINANFCDCELNPRGVKEEVKKKMVKYKDVCCETERYLIRSSKHIFELLDRESFSILWKDNFGNLEDFPLLKSYWSMLSVAGSIHFCPHCEKDTRCRVDLVVCRRKEYTCLGCGGQFVETTTFKYA
jgi:hypothetical protein